ncbi:MAG: 4Fe-4S binding protein, partial [Acholeplasmataceae bacterium]|nr:4Fe-4S binding protein [Acholeplasmataceae bacterium]
LCERICPYFAIEMRDKITFDPDLCSRCGLCVSKCPTGAIQMDLKEMNE